MPNSDNDGAIYNQVAINRRAILRNFIIAFGETKAFATVKKVLVKSLNESSLSLNYSNMSKKE